MRRHRQQSRADESRENGVRFFQHRFQSSSEWQLRIPSGLKKFYVAESTEVRLHGFESAGNTSQQQKNREDHRAKHQRRLDHVGPNNCFDSADRRVNRSDDGDENNSPNIGVKINWQRWKEEATNHQHDCAAEIQPDAYSEY